MTKVRSRQSMPSVIVTGAAGYIGSHITLAMLERGWQVIAVDDLSVGSRSAIPPGARFVEMDCGDPRLIELMAAAQVDAAVHMAGRISVEQSVADPLGYYKSNLCISRRFFESAVRASVGAIVFSSTAAVYGEAEGRPVVETDVCRPVSPYGRSKLAAEWILQDLSAATDVRHVIFRYFNVAGADPAGRAGPRAGAEHLLKRACEAAVGLRSEMTIYGADYNTPDGTCIRDYIHVSDLAEAHVAAVEHLLRGGESFTANCGYGRGFSVREVLGLASALADAPFRITIGERRPGDAEAIIANPGVLSQRLEWRPAHLDLESIIRSGITWERSMRASSSHAVGSLS